MPSSRVSNSSTKKFANLKEFTVDNIDYLRNQVIIPFHHHDLL